MSRTENSIPSVGEATVFSDRGRGVPPHWRVTGADPQAEATVITRSLTPDELSVTPAVTGFPTVVDATEETRRIGLVALLKSHRDDLLGTLCKRGAFLSRGFSLSSPIEFEAAATSLGFSLATDYDFGLTRRSRIEGNVFTSTDHNEKLLISPHTEMSYSNQRPSWIAFYCHRPSDTFGETPIFDMAGVYADLPRPLRNAFATQPVEYVRQIPAEETGSRRLRRTIKETFGTEDPSHIEELGEQMGFEVRWLRPDLLETRSRVNAVVRHPGTGDLCWNANVVSAMAYEIMYRRFAHRHGFIERSVHRLLIALSQLSERRGLQTFLLGDRALTRQELTSLYESLFKNCTIFPWRSGDLLFLDNIKAGHARLFFSGKRDIRSCFGDPYDLRQLTAV